MTCRLTVLALLLFTSILPAQTRELAPVALDTARAPRIMRRLIGETHRVAGPPRSFQIARVRVPAEVSDAERVTFEVKPLNGFTVVGRTSGSIQPRNVNDVLITIGVPASAHAGTRAAANVVFKTTDIQVDVPIEMTVTAVYGLLIQAPAQFTGLASGDHFTVALRVQNRGNAVDTVQVAIEAPPGWRVVSRDTSSLIIPPYGTADRSVRLAIPSNSGIGNFFVRTFARSRGAESQAPITLAVGPSVNEMRPPGPVLRAAMGTVAVDGEGVESVSQIEMAGPLTSTIHVNGRVTTTPELSGPLVRGLARVGTYVSAPHLTAWTTNWRLRAGSTVLAMTDLTGLNAGGRGVAFDFSDTTRAFSVLAARSDENSAARSNRGELFGAHIEHKFGFGQLGASAAHLNGVGLQHHQLTAFAAQARTAPIKTLRFGGEAAYRDYSAGSGLGWQARVQHERGSERVDLRITHAPGGTEAFARAENEVHASFSKAFGDQFDVAASFVSAIDKTTVGRAFESRSLLLMPSYRVHDQLRVRAEVRHNSLDVASAPLGYGNGETHVGIGAGGAWRGFSYSSDVGVAGLSRSVIAPDIEAVDHGTRLSWRFNATRPTDIGIFQLETSYERNSGETGYLPEQFSVTLRNERISLPSISNRLHLNAELTMHGWTGVETMSVLRAGATYALPLQTDVALAVERNPLLSGLNQRTPWIFALKLEKSLGLPRVAINQPSGVVYRDFNSDGRRNVGEPGEANVVVRRGSARATTSQDGEYRFWEAAHGELTIDPATLPYGWIIGDRKNGDVALVPTTRVEVNIQLGEAERLRNIDLSSVVVTARDARGRAFTARRVAPDVAIFEALPVGIYTLDADFSAVAEPLRVEGGAVTVQVVESAIAKVILPVAGRPLRFRPNRP